jgi:hypothetical protein
VSLRAPKRALASADSHDYIALRDAVIAKYGAAAKTENSTIENRMGCEVRAARVAVNQRRKPSAPPAV